MSEIIANMRLVKGGKTYEIYVANELAMKNHEDKGWTRIKAEPAPTPAPNNNKDKGNK